MDGWIYACAPLVPMWGKLKPTHEPSTKTEDIKKEDQALEATTTKHKTKRKEQTAQNKKKTGIVTNKQSNPTQTNHWHTTDAHHTITRYLKKVRSRTSNQPKLNKSKKQSKKVRLTTENKSRKIMIKKRRSRGRKEKEL